MKLIMAETLLTIREAAKRLCVSIDTLRRWDRSGKLVAVRKPGGVHRFYQASDLDIFTNDLAALAYNWAVAGGAVVPDYYCSNSGQFQARLNRLQHDVQTSNGFDSSLVALIIGIAGEIGNNSFDHNLGKWPGMPGTFFAHDGFRRLVVLADRGIGILASLQRVRPSLSTSRDALFVAFSEVISGRSPEARGNGLKFVRQAVIQNPFSLVFQSGDTQLQLKQGDTKLQLTKTAKVVPGCYALIYY